MCYRVALGRLTLIDEWAVPTYGDPNMVVCDWEAKTVAPTSGLGLQVLIAYYYLFNKVIEREIAAGART